MTRIARAPDAAERSKPREAPPSAAPADSVLALHGAVGNRAVAAMLARDTTEAVPQDAKGGKKPAEAPPVTGPRVVSKELGVIAITSAQLPSPRPPTTGTGGPGQGRTPPPQEITLTSRQGAHSAALFKLSTDGTPMDVEIYTVSGLKLKLKGALVTSYQLGQAGDDPIETWTLNATSVEFEYEKKDQPGGVDAHEPGPASDLGLGKGA